MERSAKWVNKYEQFLLKNSSQISSIESSLRSLSFILPGRFKDVEIASESLYSILQILGMYHDSIISKAVKKKDPNFKPCAHNRYTQFQLKHNVLYKAVSVILQLSRYTELLWEMVAKRKGGENTKWRAVIGVELWKVVLRLTLLVHTRRPVPTPPMPEREADSANDDDETSEEPVASVPPWKMPRSGGGLDTTPMAVDEYLSSRVLTAEDVKSPVELLHVLSNNRALAAEVVYILRPLVYSLLSYRYRHRPKNWTPWVVGFAIEVLSRNQMLAGYQEMLPGGFRSTTKLEADEIQKRGMSLWWWGLRGAMYTQVTKPLVEATLRKTRWIPGSGLVSGIVDDYLYLLDNYHFSSSSL